MNAGLFDEAKRVPILDVCRELLPDGRQVGDVWHAVNPTRGDTKPGSFRIHVAGPREGMWCDFATGDKGSDAASLVAYLRGTSQAEAARQLVGAPPARTKPAASGFAFPSKTAPPPPPKHPKLGAPDVVYTYRAASGAPLLYVYRWEARGENRKEIRPLTWDGSVWAWRGIPSGEPTPLYGLDRLGDASRPVIVVEGEKCADALHAHMGEHVAVVCWIGGSSAVGRVKLDALHGRTVTLWPDADDVGRTAMAAIGERLSALGCDVSTVRTDGRADGYDAADALAEGADIGEILAAAVEAERPEPKPEPARKAGPLRWVHVDDKNRPLATIENLDALLVAQGVTVSYNLMTHRAEAHIPGRSYTDENADLAALAEVKSMCNRYGLPVGQVDGYLLALSDRGAYHPVVDWIASEPWDGVDRLASLFDTIPFAGDERRVGLSRRLLRRWMISACRAAHSRDGLDTHGVLVFQGPGGKGKTRWLRRLCPVPDSIRDGVQLDLRSKDSIIGATSAWICELGELDGTLRRSSGAPLKAFLTKTRDEHRRAYAATETRAGRRTVFAGTVNEGLFLDDPNGERRWWVVPVRDDSYDYDHDLPMQQVWAQVRTLDVGGEQHWLTDDERDALEAANRDFTAPDFADEMLTGRFDFTLAGTQWMTAAECAAKCVERPDDRFVRALASSLRRRGCERRAAAGGRSEWKVPPQRG